MGSIKKLPDHVINQIKAGEVVDRPASVVKELVENALDAGGGDITIELLDGGKQLIRITDNGKGMDSEDLAACLERHATSKLRALADLDTISSLGFRGEALPSIASVSRFSIRSRTRGAPVGHEIEVEDGQPGAPLEVAMPEGTSVSVRDIFINVPARQKFLKSTATEFSHIHDFLFATALAYPHIGFRFVHNGRDVFWYRKQKGAAERFAEVLGAESREFVPVEFERGSFRITGFAGLPATARPMPKYFVTFVNGRMVRDRVVRAGVLQAYNGLLLKGLLPSAIVFLQVEPAWLDVNVHPSKTELRFHDGAAVQELVAMGIQNAVKEELARRDTLQSTLASAARPSAFARVSAPEEPPAGEEPGCEGGEAPSQTPLRGASSYSPPVVRSAPPSGGFSPRSPSPGPSSWSSPRPSASAPVTQGRPAPLPARDSATPEPLSQARERSVPPEPTPEPRLFDEVASPFAGARYLGQFRNCYLLLECASELWVVDQHAFHERILFEELVRQSRGDKVVGRNELLAPILVPVPRGTAGVVADFGDRLLRLGFKVEALGNDRIAVHAVPALLEPSRAAAIFDEILVRILALAGVSSSDVHPLLVRAAAVRDEVAALHASSLSEEAVYHLFFATMACHTAVRAGEALAPEQVRRLLDRAGDVDFFSHCPHGRPVVRKFTDADVALWFARL